MVDCKTDLKRLVPLYRVVSAAIIDMHEDHSKLFQVMAHFAARGLKKLDREILKTTIHGAVLTINRNTNTATLPPDFDEEVGVFVIVDGKKIPLRLRPELVDSNNMNEIECDDTKCPKCAQDTKICNDLTVTEDTVLVVIKDSTYEQTIIKKLYPDGSYFLETRIPVWDENTQAVTYTTQKEFIATISLKACGCIDDTEENLQTIKTCCPDIYCQYYTPCNYNCETNYGGYKIFPESNLIQFDAVGSFQKAYIEYRGFMPKKNGQYMVPEVAFETLVNYAKFKWVENKRNIPRWERLDTFEHYKRERDNMQKVMGRISLSRIIQSIGLIPKFDVETFVCDPAGIGYSTDPIVTSSSSSSGTGSTTGGGSGSDSGTDDCNSETSGCPPTPTSLVPLSIATVAGSSASDKPTVGINTYQNDKLKSAVGVNTIIVNNTNETIKAGQFVINTTTGTITRYQGDGVTPNNWQTGDILIIPTFFKAVVGAYIPTITTPASDIRAMETFAINGDTTVVVDVSGFSIYKVSIKPDQLSNIKIGTTLGGDEIMFEEQIAAFAWRANTIELYTGVIYVTMTGTATLNVYKEVL